MSTSKYPSEIKINPNKGGKAAIERLVEAYGFTTRQALADHLEVSKSTLANRYLRDTFPADWIIQCALETGTSLKWLTTGQGLKQSSLTVATEDFPSFALPQAKCLKMVHMYSIHHFFLQIFHHQLLFRMGLSHTFVIKNFLKYLMDTG